jgi:hypothetical protein
MGLDRDLIDAIKMNFADYSSAQLQTIAQSTESERWSAEALEAAREILLDRGAGRAEEPLNPTGPELPPPVSYNPGLVPLGVLGGLLISPLIGTLIMRFFRGDSASKPDRPVPFGFEVAWLALETTDTQDVATALGLFGVRRATWAEGIKAAYQSSIFVTPPLADWTLAVGTALFPPDPANAYVKPLLEELSRQFGDAQYFCTQGGVELHVWARARKGRLVRGYGWHGEKGLTLWDEGAPTKDEGDLGLSHLDEHSITVGQARNKNVTVPDESCVMQLASLWSIDPTTLDEQFKEPVMGLLGNGAWR